MVQYLVKRSAGKVTFDPLTSTIPNTKFGDIYYEKDQNNEGTRTSVFHWKSDITEVRAYANHFGATGGYVERAVHLISSDPTNYPDIYVIFKTGTIKQESVTISAKMNIKDHIIPEYLYKANEYSTLGKDEIHANTMTPEDNDKTLRNTYTYVYNTANNLEWDDLTPATGDRDKSNDLVETRNAWKPAYLDDTFSDVFVGNLASGKTPLNWNYTWTGGTTAQQNDLKNNLSQLLLDFVFDSSNTGKQFKGYIDNSGNAKTFKLQVSSDKKTLFAYITSMTVDPDTIAEIVVDGAADLYQNRWNNNISRLQKMRIDYKRHTKRGYAEALLNYKGSHELDNNTLKVTVAVEATAKISRDPGITGMSEVECQLPLTENTFDVRFLRPISIDKSKTTTITDAYNGGESSQVIKIRDLKPNYKDWRELEWKTIPNYEQYYAPNGEQLIGFNLAGNFASGQNISSDPNVKTTLGGKTTPVALNTVSEQLDFTYYDTYVDPITLVSYNEPVLVYRNLSSTVGDFKVMLPVKVEYYWGTYYDTVEITVKRTAGVKGRK